MRKKSIQSRNVKSKSRKILPPNYLIVCEGKETEPKYINGLKEAIQQKCKNSVDIFIPKIEVKGTGLNTNTLVEHTAKYVNQSTKIYAKVFIMFDKDNYTDKQFDTAIKSCKENLIAIWSNPCIEVFLLAHFTPVNRTMTTKQAQKELDKALKREYGMNYQKNYENIYQLCTNNKRLDEIINNCCNMENFNPDLSFSKQNPMTKAYIILEEFKPYLEEK